MKSKFGQFCNIFVYSSKHIHFIISIGPLPESWAQNLQFWYKNNWNWSTSLKVMLFWMKTAKIFIITKKSIFWKKSTECISSTNDSIFMKILWYNHGVKPFHADISNFLLGDIFILCYKLRIYGKLKSGLGIKISPLGCDGSEVTNVTIIIF